MKKKLCIFVLALSLALFAGNAFSTLPPAQTNAKYVFVFIGDGMGVAQRNAAELYLADQKGISRPEEAKLLMNTFPAQGMNTTYDLSSIIPDSASTATAIATGSKTKSGVIGMDADAKISYETIAEKAKKKGWKVGIVSSVSLDHVRIGDSCALYGHCRRYHVCKKESGI